MQNRALWGLLRMSMAWIFLWPFLDKLFGLGFSTASENAWIRGGSPTMGFLKFGTKGPFADAFQALAGNTFVDIVFMVGLLAIGVALLLGIGMRVAAISGALMMFLMWLAVLPPEHNPFLDDHIVYALVLLVLAWNDAGSKWGLGEWWARQPIVISKPWLR